ncbi:HD domain-containing protein [Paenibacillus alkalitolerans]|uniref:HD domain-containing protein n=1 Tax=Paenibacillus alkalitolerans TaxID=2799335 RepID=UPI0018F6B7A5|nr:HD domain-containing protein [Paenibacillus alkalitolerans]
MKSPYNAIKINNITGNIREDVYQFLVINNRPQTAEHCMLVGDEAKRIAEIFNVNIEAAEVAGYLHDISAVFANEVRVQVAQELELEVLPEEKIFPMIIHQKISKAMARDIFNVQSPEILDAVGCHTTLRKGSTILDKVLFVADKIRWDQAGNPPYLGEILKGLNRSLEHAAFAYINYLWNEREKLRVVHPWLRDAYYELKEQLG